MAEKENDKTEEKKKQQKKVTKRSMRSTGDPVCSITQE